MSNLIKNRVKYHAPINFYEDVDFDKITSLGIDLSLPVFIMEKPLNKLLIKSFVEAQKEVDFNLILYKNNKKLQKRMKHCFVLKQSEIEGIDKLNINYKTQSKYHKLEYGNYIKIKNKFENFEEKDFYLEQKEFVDGVFVNIKKFLLSGENHMIEMSNCTNKQIEIEVEYNHDLERGYYVFEKLKNGLKIINLTTRQKMFLNTNFGKFQEDFSCVDGLENSTYARVNLKTKITLKPFEKRAFFINFGNKFFILKNQGEMELVLKQSIEKNYEIFDIKIASFDKSFEKKFNTTLPQKIWRAWLDGKCDKESEKEYVDLKNQIVLKKKRKVELLKNDLKIQDVLLFNGKYYKKIATRT